MPAISAKDILRRCLWVNYRRVEEEGILLHTKDCTFFGINETGVFLWEAIDGRRPIGRLAEELQREFRIPPEQARTDLIDWAGRLLDAGLVELANPPGA